MEELRGAWLWPPPTSIPDQPPWSWRLLLTAFSTARHVGTRPERRRPQPPPRSTCCPSLRPGRGVAVHPAPALPSPAAPRGPVGATSCPLQARLHFLAGPPVMHPPPRWAPLWELQ